MWSELRLNEILDHGLLGDTTPQAMIQSLTSLIRELQARNDPTHGPSLVSAQQALANAYQRLGDIDAAIAAQDQAQQLAEKHLAHAPEQRLPVRLAHAGFMVERDPAQGVKLLEALDRDYVRLIGESTPLRAVLLNQMSVGLSKLKRNKESLDAITRATGIARRSAGEDNRLYLQLGVTLAQGLIRDEHYAEAGSVLRGVLPGLKARSGPGVNAVNYAYALGTMGRLQVLQKDAAAAISTLRLAEEVIGDLAGEYLVVYNNIIQARVRAHLALAQLALAQRDIDRYQQLVDSRREPADSPWRKSLEKLRAELAEAGKTVPRA